MNDQQKTGGIAALVLAATFVIGIAVFAAVFLGSAFESSEPVEVVEFLADYQAVLSIWYVIIYVVFGIALVILTLALNERLKPAAPAMTQSATQFRSDGCASTSHTAATSNQKRQLPLLAGRRFKSAMLVAKVCGSSDGA